MAAASLADAVRLPFAILATDRLPKQKTQLFEPNQTIATPPDTLYMIKGGAVNVVMRPSSGESYPVSTLTVGDCFGEQPVLGLSLYGATALAGPDGAELVPIPAPIARELADSPGTVAAHFGPRLVATEAARVRAVFQTVPSRIAKFLLDNQRNGRVVGFTQAGLATQLGVYRETVANGFSQMRRAGLIEGGGRGALTILDMDGLRRLAEM